MRPIVEITALRKSFGANEVLKGIDLTVASGEVIAIIGATSGERELTTLARDTLTETSNATPLTVAAIMYLVITLPLTRLVAWMERRTQRAR